MMAALGDGGDPPCLDPQLVMALEQHKAAYHEQYKMLQEARSSAKQLEAMIQGNRRRIEHDFRCWDRRNQTGGAASEAGGLNKSELQELKKDTAMEYFFDEVCVLSRLRSQLLHRCWMSNFDSDKSCRKKE